MPDPSAPRLCLAARPVARLPDPLQVLRRLGHRRHAFLRLVSGGGFRGAPWSVFGVDPVEEIRVGTLRAGARLDERLAPLRPRPVVRSGPPLPFHGGWAGMIGYEARSGIEARPGRRRCPLDFPCVWLGRYAAVLAWDHRSRKAYVSGVGGSASEARRAASELLGKLRAGARRGQQNGVLRASRPRARVEPEAFRRAVRAARNAVRKGDIFQANVSQRFDARIQGAPVELFARLVASQPAPYMTYLDCGRGRRVLSASPERFLRVRGRTVETDPMKGTRPRGRSRREDMRLRDELASCEKERAELAMIVDLSRNDLARVCEPGSVRVTVPRRLLRFAGVHQAIAVVRGRLRPGLDRVDLLQAAFPPGSVTGAPKVRAMEVIDDLEGEGRGPYCGALGWFDEGGDMDLAVGIRTILLTDRSASYRVGAGITLRSDPRAEWRETLDKGTGLFAALAGAATQP